MCSKKAFTKNSRLRTTKDYQKVYNSPKKFRKKGWLILAHQNDLSLPRLGISISKKNVSKAVDRNRFKRLIRESFRLRRQSLPNVDLIVICYANELKELTEHEISINLEALWSELVEYYKSAY